MPTTKYYKVKPEHIEHYQMFLNCPTTGECICLDSVVYKRLLQAKVLDIWCDEIKEKERVKGWFIKEANHGGEQTILTGPYKSPQNGFNCIYIDSEIQ